MRPVLLVPRVCIIREYIFEEVIVTVGVIIHFKIIISKFKESLGLPLLLPLPHYLQPLVSVLSHV